MGKINLLYARESDRKLIYELTIEDKEVISAMFNSVNDFHWEEIRDEKSIFFDEKPSRDKYLLIEYEKEIIGVFCHIFHDSLIKNIEFHIWLRSMKYAGVGIGTKILSTMLEYLHKEYSIDTFLMRPWIKNTRAVHTYNKCGFEIVENFILNNYFTKEEILLHGNGAYVEEETVNMTYTFSQKSN